LAAFFLVPFFFAAFFFVAIWNLQCPRLGIEPHAGTVELKI
jgi:hypothetical protein